MPTSQLVLQRYIDLLERNELDAAFNYLAEDVIYVTWLGIVEGKDNVVTFLRDNVRFMHFRTNFNRWRSVQHCLDADLKTFGTPGSSETSFFNQEGYDSQGYATYERDGTVAKYAKAPLEHYRVKQTVVIRDNQIVLVTLTQQL
ncbi:hypothetical protein ABB37_03124 [Leptomonas pyrrhocoris]|uniref:SnoaL-like domain-containing protein n=1 Tax=Leptomonas pyrrhocoris TaxID=157538 RepID=A0A0M9G6V3_LEPPY|nr:hypothetical protein ABB37_03124 [Leptomonas pyrrhocoris]KPA83529.1 hypothetical protein ABB37_03124 [Leptomonas pyrrhocoris]|eukprot:XP_015661968.1 hypothetical protein ABB37_03124 [Leptomonas pyrrhocoris]